MNPTLFSACFQIFEKWLYVREQSRNGVCMRRQCSLLSQLIRRRGTPRDVSAARCCMID